MQDEVLKHTEKIYKLAKNSEHSLRKRINEILIEIFIIVFAVTVSIWLHNWSEHRNQRAEAKDFLIDLRSDLAKDIHTLTEKKKYLNSSLDSYSELKNLTEEQIDTANNINLNFSLSALKINNGNYEGFKSSGKIGLIENKKLKKLILQYYEENLPGLYDVEKYHYSKALETFEMISSFSKAQNKLLSDPSIRAKINLDAMITQALATACDQTIEQATEILKEIDEVLD
jgi:hypothetical protein